MESNPAACLSLINTYEKKIYFQKNITIKSQKLGNAKVIHAPMAWGFLNSIRSTLTWKIILKSFKIMVRMLVTFLLMLQILNKSTVFTAYATYQILSEAFFGNFFINFLKENTEPRLHCQKKEEMS